MKRVLRSDIRFTGILLAILLIIGSAACQPTPETPPVVGKGDNHLEEMIASSALSPSPAEGAPSDTTASSASLMEAAEAPETFKDSYTNGKGDVTVTIDAKVEVPPVDTLPAVQVKLCGFSQKQVDKLGEYFLKGAKAYEEEQGLTKEQIQEIIVEEEQSLEEMKNSNRNEGIKESEKFLEEMRKQYAQAPAEKKRTPSTLQLQSDENGTHLFALADLGKDEEAEFRVSNIEGYADFIFSNDGKGRYDSVIYEQEELDGNPRGMNTSREDAESIVIQCLSDLGITDMLIESIKAATYYENDNDYNEKGYKASARQCYVFNLVRTIGGALVIAIEESEELATDDPDVPAPKEPEYNCIRDPEKLEICVDDTGIVRFEWTNPLETEAVLSEHVALSPFEDIVRRARDNIFYKNYTAYGSKTRIYITSIKLSMMRIMRKNRPGEYLVVPVWDFIGNHKFGGERLPFGDQSYVTINAIDGSWINRDWGY